MACENDYILRCYIATNVVTVLVDSSTIAALTMPDRERRHLNRVLHECLLRLAVWAVR